MQNPTGNETKKMQKVSKRDKGEGEGRGGAWVPPRGGRRGGGAGDPGRPGEAPPRVACGWTPAWAAVPSRLRHRGQRARLRARRGRGKGHPLEGSPGSAWEGGWSSCPLGGIGPVLKNSQRRHCDLRGRLFPQRSGKQGILQPWAPPGLFSPSASVPEASWGLPGGQHTSEGRTHPSWTRDGDSLSPRCLWPSAPPPPPRSALRLSTCRGN